MDRWRNYFLSIAEVCARQSKDPSTKVGAVIADRFDRVVSMGFNGLPRGVKDKAAVLKDREVKNMVTLHAEVNAIVFAKQDVSECIIYCTHVPCSQCSALIIQAGIKEVVVGVESGKELSSAWDVSIAMTRKMFKEAGVKMVEVPR